VAVACQKPKELGYPHELWTTRLLAAHARDQGPAAGHPSLAKLAQGTVCKILADRAVKPHRVRYYLEKRDPEFEPKMAEILCVYREVAVLRAQEQSAANAAEGIDGSQAIISYDEKPGIQAIGTSLPRRRPGAPDLPPLPGRSPTVMRDHEYKRHGTVILMAGIDLVSGHVLSQARRRRLSGRYGDRDHPRQPFGACLARDHGLAGRAAARALHFHLHPDPRLVAEFDRGLLLQTRTLRAPPNPRRLETRTQRPPDGLHRRRQSRANPPHLQLQNQQGGLIA